MDPFGLFSTPVSEKSLEYEYYYDDNYFDYSDNLNRRFDFENYASESVPYYQTLQGIYRKGVFCAIQWTC